MEAIAKKARGGKRSGCGRKKGPEKVQIWFRVEKEKKDEIRQKIEEFIKTL